MPTSTPIAPVAEIERRLHWRAVGIAVFLALIVTLAAMAVVTVLVPVPMRDGLPVDVDVARAGAALHDRVPIPTAPLRFACALLGEARPGAIPGAGDEARIENARALIEGARSRRRGDPRLDATLGHLDLALGRLSEAEKRYRAVTDGGADVPEARLGLGVVLAQAAAVEREPLLARGLLLEAVSQWVAVDPRSAVHPIALYDRAVTLARLDRRAEAAQVARAYLALDPAGPWATRLREEIAR